MLECIPAQLYVRVICRPKYATPDGGVVIAEMPDMAFPKSNAGASLIASVLTGKYVDHLPLHRQAEIFGRSGYEISSSTMTNWVQHGIERLKPLYNHIVNLIRSSEYVQVDETTLPVLKADKPGATVKGYLWSMRSPLARLTAFHWDAGSRSARTLVDMMGEFQGAMQSDGYNAYNVYDKVKGVTRLAAAILYTANIYPRLARYVTDGSYNIDNNGIENAIRPVALGRKNYLYCGNDASAERTAIIYTIVSCCRSAGVNPFEYLTHILPLVDGTPPSKYDILLPEGYREQG
ncbi:MAG: transposase [Rikenellaceae bacterium]